MEWYEAEVRELERAHRTQRLPPRPVAFYGSSSITLWDTLAQDLDHACVMNIGFGGSTLEACLLFFERLVLPVHPASLVLYAGENDLGDGRTALQVADWFQAFIGKVERHLTGIPFGFISIKPSPARVALLDEILEANRLIGLVIASRPAACYVDVFTPMLDANRQPRRSLFLDDGLHLNRAGYQLWTRELERYHDRIFTPGCPSGHTGGLTSKDDGP